MGEKINREHGKSNGDNNKSNKNTETGGRGGSSTSTNTTGAGGTSGTGGTSGGRAETKEKGIPKLVTVEVPDENLTPEEKKRLERNAKRREAYQRNKGKKKQATKQTEILDNNQLTILLMTIGNIAGSREGMEHWRLTQAECEQIALPLSNILKDSLSGESVEKYADHIALVVACMSIFIPRLVITVNKKKVRKQTNGVIKFNDKRKSGEPDKAGKTNVSNRKHNGETANNGENDDTGIPDILAGIGE